MANKVEIANRALIRIGSGPIMAFTDSSKEARTISAVWENTRLSVLREHTWKFATTRVHLSPLTPTPAFGYTYQFQTPSDFVRMKEIEDNPVYRVEGGVILCDEPSIDLVYIRDPGADVGAWDDLAAEALTAKLAFEICYRITQDIDLRDMIEKEYRKALSRAKSMDAKDQPYMVLDAEDWLEARQISSDRIPGVSS